MDISTLIHQYGYLAVAVGSFFEGEAILLAGSVAAYHGHLALPAVLLLAALLAFISPKFEFLRFRNHLSIPKNARWSNDSWGRSIQQR